MQNVLKRKNIFGRIFEFSPSKSYVLYHSESIDMNIEKLLKTHNFLLVSAKKRFLPYGRGGGSESYGHVRNY